MTDKRSPVASPELPSLSSCSEKETFDWLLSHRFHGDVAATRKFLSKAAATPAAVVSPEKPKEDPTLSCESVSFISPRGKFDLSFYQQLIFAINAKQSTGFEIKRGNVRSTVIFPKPEDFQKKSTQDMCLVRFQEPVSFKNKKLSVVCFQLPKEAPKNLLNSADDTPHVGISNQWADILCQSTGIEKVVRVRKPAEIKSDAAQRHYQFCSYQNARMSSTTGGLPFVKCYNGVHDGVLFPLLQGLLFYKPPLFIPRDQLVSIACGRGTDSSSRYVDLLLTMTGAKEVQFTNIHRDEMSVLNDYIHKTLIPAMRVDAGTTPVAGDDETANSNDDDAPNSDHTTTESSSNNKRRRRAPKREASVEATTMNKRIMLQHDNDDEDDDDAEYGNDSSSASSADDSDDDGNDDDDDQIVEAMIKEDDETETEEEDDDKC